MSDLSTGEGVTIDVGVDPIGQVTAGDVPRSDAFRPIDTGLRRAIDLVVAFVLLVLASPLLLVTTLAIRFDSPGPALFRQVRVGRHGRHFEIYKFRGMYVDAQQRFPDMYAYQYSPEEIPSLRFHPDNDPRITRVGAFIRRTSLDELPNLVNVIKGDMSLVGPRPEIPEMIHYYGEATGLLLTVKPGVTSLPKVTGRDQLTFAETLALDLEYVRSRSLLLDLKILVRTANTLFADGWAS